MSSPNDELLLVEDINGEQIPCHPVDEEDIVASCENIHKTYLLGVEGVPALRGVSADVYKRDFLVIYGTSGGGKSSFLNVLGTIDVPTKGNLQLFDRRVTERTPDAFLALLRCRKIGFVFQSFNLLSTMTALDNVKLPMIIAGELDGEAMEARAKELLISVGLGHRLGHFPSQLSGGEQQRVTIARALSNAPSILLLDEPTGDLDTRSTHIIMNILLDLNLKKGITMVMVTHDGYMKKYATRVVHLRDGRLAKEERINHKARVNNIRDLKKTVIRIKDELEEIANGGKDDQSGPGKFVEERRNAQDYATFTTKASQRTFRTHDQPVLFQELFGKNRVLEKDSKSIPMNQKNNNNEIKSPQITTASSGGGTTASTSVIDENDELERRREANLNPNNRVVVHLPRRGKNNEDDEYGSTGRATELRKRQL